jgi:hypothetical protein
VKKTEDESEWVETVSTGDDEEATLIAGFLKAQGIPAIVEGPTSTAFPEDLGTFGMSRVMVPPDRADEAKQLLANQAKEGRDRPQAEE